MGIFDTMFNRFRKTVTNMSQFKFMSYTPIFSSFGKKLYKSATIRSTVDAIAVNAAKLKPVHIRVVDGAVSPVKKSKIEYALSVRANPILSAYDFWYQMFSQRETKNNAFALIDYKRDGALELYPILYSYVEAMESEGFLFLRFNTNSGKQLTVPYDEVIHLRRHLYEHDVFGENNDPILPTLELLNTVDEGLGNAIKSTAYLRGILQFTNTMLKPDDIKKQRDDFIEDYMDLSNNGGIAALDAKAEYKELKGEPKFINPVQTQFIKGNVYDYFGVNQKIVQCSYSEDEWNAFYESKLEPMGLQASLECTYKLFTSREIGVGNQIIFEANRLQYASNKTKVAIIQNLMPLGMLTQNEGREIFNMAPLPDGDRRFISLNYIDTEIVNDYQLEKVKGGDNGEGSQQED